MSEKALQYLAELQPHKALVLLKRELVRLQTKKNKGDVYGALINYAVAQRGCGLIHEARETLYKALAMDATKPEAWCNLAQCAEDLAEFEQAPALFQRALQCIEKTGLPVHSAGEPLMGFAYSMMRLEKFQYAWPIWEASRISRTWHPFPALNAWKGEPNARLLVVPEGGFGDGFNFLRWIPWVPTPVNRATVLVWDPLYEYTKAALDFVSPSVLPLSHKFQFDELAQFTHCTPYLSLPAYSMKTWGDIPPKLNWEPRGRIVAEPNDWIGFCWRAEENGVMRKTRSLDAPAARGIAKYLKSSCERVVSLIPAGKELYRKNQEPVPPHVTQDEALLTDWETTARTILKCKAVVTVDTAVYHLAGSLGVPTVLMLPLRSDWKHSTDEIDRWYGGVVKILRNTHPVDWMPMVDKVKRAI